MSIPLKKANILLPKNADMEKWAVIACDQYTSEPYEDIVNQMKLICALSFEKDYRDYVRDLQK